MKILALPSSYCDPVVQGGGGQLYKQAAHEAGREKGGRCGAQEQTINRGAGTEASIFSAASPHSVWHITGFDGVAAGLKEGWKDGRVPVPTISLIKLVTNHYPS